jgi:flagellar hook assembly protein FlgD
MIPTGFTSKVIPVRLRVTDGCGNVSYCTSNVTLVRATTLDNTGQGNKASVYNDTPISNKPVVPSNVLTTHGDMQCFPNPFSEDLNINYNLTEKVDHVIIKLYDNQGKVVQVLDQGESVVGYYTVRWNLSNLNSGMYHVCLEFNDKCQKLQRVIMIK